jgi:hypothetical protein
MKRLIFLICLVLPTTAWADQKPALLDIYQDEPAIQEQFMIWDFGDREELTVSSNGLFLPRQEFGTYVRKPTDFPGQVEKLIHSIDGTGFNPPPEKTSAWPNWHVLLEGEEIDPVDPRFNAAFKLLREQIKQSVWRRKDVTIATLRWRPFQLLVSHLRYSDKNSKLLRPHITSEALEPLETCPEAVGDHLVCRLSNGFIYLNTPPKITK